MTCPLRGAWGLRPLYQSLLTRFIRRGHWVSLLAGTRVLGVTLVLLLVAPAFSGCLDNIEGPPELFPETLVYTPRKVWVENNQLYVDGRVFVVKGVNYSPLPPGKDPFGADREWSFVDHPELYKKDLELMKRMGVNTIRLTNTTGNIPAMTKFLDEAHRFGIMVMIGHQGPMGLDSRDPVVREEFKRQVMHLVEGFRLHPAVLMWLLGNEVNLWYPGDKDVRDWYTLLEETTRAVKSRDPNHPVATANNALKDVMLWREVSPSVDIYGTNQYILDDKGWNDWLYPAYYASVPDRPILITEFGADAINSDTGLEYPDLQAAILTDNWREIFRQSHGGFNQSIGGCVFEWTDEWWKQGNPDTHDGTKDWVPEQGTDRLPDRAFSEEYFGIVSVDPETYERNPREAFHALQSLWSDPREDSPPALVNVRAVTEGNLIRVTADVVSYGDIGANVTMRYRLKADAWKEVSMKLENGTYVATLGPFDGVAILFYTLKAVDGAGRVKESRELTARAVPGPDGAMLVGGLLAGVALYALVGTTRRRGRGGGGP